jgi:hypothetical protein
MFDDSGQLVKTIPDIYGAKGMVVVGSTLYVVESTTGSIEAINLTTLTADGSVATGLADPLWIAFAGGKLWTAEGGSNTWDKLVSVGLTGGTTVFPTTYYSADLASSPGTPDLLYVAEDGLSPGGIFEFDVSGGSPVAMATNGFTDQENIEGLAVSSDGSRVIPASGYPYEFEELSPSTLTADGILYPGAAYPAAVTVSARGLLATGLFGYDSADISLFELGIPSAIFTASTSAAN